MISDTSRTIWNNPSPNAGIFSSLEPGILVIPRHPNNLFFNVYTPADWVAEYNCFYYKSDPLKCGGASFDQFRYSSEHGFEHAASFRGPCRFSRTTKWGRELGTGPQGFNFFAAALRSFDRGMSWSGPVVVSGRSMRMLPLLGPLIMVTEYVGFVATWKSAPDDIPCAP